MTEYKGLTIRIGGDTSQLNSALKASTKAASSLQAQIRQITRAMRFDPGNLGNIDTRMRLTTNRAEALYAKIRLVKSGYEELGKTTVRVGGSVTTVKKLAESTDNVALAASAAKERYNDMTKNLAANYRELEARAREAGKAMNLNALSRQGSDDTFEKQMAQLKELGVVTDDEIQKLREMRSTWNEAFESSESWKAASQLEGMSVDMQRFESEARNATATVRELNTASRYSAENWQESAAKLKSVDSALGECTRQAREYEAALRKDPSNMDAAVGRLKALSNGYALAEDKARALSKQVEAYREKLAGTLAETKNLPRFIQETGDKWQKVHDELSQAKGEASALAQSLQRLKDAEAPVEEIRQLEAEVAKADARVDALNRSAAEMDGKFETAKECAELQRLESELAEAGASARAFDERMKLTSLGGKSVLNASTVKSIGMSLYSTLTPAITMLGWRAVSAAQDMDSAYRDMRKTVDGTEAQFEELRQAAIEFSKTHVTSAEQILQIEAIGGELGIATEDLRAFAETVSNLDVATNLNTEEAASSLGKLANITHMTSDEYDNYADALVRLGNNGASTEDQIVDITTRIGSMGTIVGMTVPELLALSSSIAATGMKTEASGTAIANTISDMESAVAQGGDSLEAFASVSQMSAEEFAKTWEEEPIAAFEAFIKGLNQIEKDGGSADATLEKMGITGTRQKQAIEGLMQTIGGLDDNLAMSRHAWKGESDAWGAAGDAAREAQKKAEGFSGQLAILSNVGNDAMAALAEGAAPIVGAITDVLKDLLGVFEDMDDGAKTAAVALLGMGAAIGPLLTLGSSLVIAKNNMVAFFTESTAMGRAVRIMKSGFMELDAGMGPGISKMNSLKLAVKELGMGLARGLAVGAAVAAIGLLASAIWDYIEKAEKAKEASKNAGDVISQALGDPVDGAARNIESLSQSYYDMVEKMAESNKAIQESADEVYGKAEDVERYGDAVKEALAAYNDDKSTKNLAELKTQLDLYNSAAGTSITLTEGESGALKLMKDDAELTADGFDKLTASMMQAAKAQFFQDAYTKKMEDYHLALDEVARAESEINRLQEERAQAVDAGDFDTATDLSAKLREANTVLDESKQKLGETTSAMNQYEEGMKLMAEAQLENASGAVQWVAGQDALQASIWANSQSVTDFAHVLEGLGVGYDELAGHEDEIASMASTWDGSTGQIIDGLHGMNVELDLSKKKVEGLDAAKIGGKTYYVTDNGTILNQEGALAGLQAVTINGKTYYVDDGGTIFDNQAKVGSLKSGIASINGKTFKVTDGGSASASKKNVDGLSDSIKDVKGKTVDVKADVSGKTAVDNLKDSISRLVGKSIDVVTNYKTTHSATGSVSDSPYIPRHAAGYIATGATLTNNGWVGEAGAEAVLNWGTGGAVVPLTNRKYMLPIADAIAANMSGDSSSVVNNVTINLTYDSTREARQMAQDLADELNAILAMGA